ncbi:MAG: metallophosphoesterase [Proteobacteria bacterium]|nr:metallophosphoesterase [Pseudomonadota bacterium]MBU6425637.1 metallophosphoesterase [Rhodospirillales bacterium]
MQLTRREFVTTSAVLGAGAALARPASAEDASISFLLVGDWGRHGYHHQRDVARQMGRTAQAINSAYTVSVGDNFYENGVESVADWQWRSSFEDVYTEASLQTPWKVVLGNHDYRGNVQAQLDYTKLSSRWRLPARYYVETTALPGGATAAFYYLDTSPLIKKYYGTRVAVDGQNSQEQLDWLDAKLAASTADWNIVIGHHPIYTAQSDADGYDHDQPDLIARLNPILQKHHVPIYVCGHDHLLQAVKMDGISYVCTGAGSETYAPEPAIRGGFASGSHGFMAARLSGKQLAWSFVDAQGNALYSQSIVRT